MPNLPLGTAEAALLEVSLPLWQHLGALGDAHDRVASKRAFRALSRALWARADCHVTSVTNITLGSHPWVRGEEQFAGDEASWLAKQREQQQAVTLLLGRLGNLKCVELSSCMGGLSQLVLLLRGMLLSRIKELRLSLEYLTPGCMEGVPANLLPSGMPQLESLTLDTCSCQYISPLLLSLASFHHLHTLKINVDQLDQLPAGFFAGLATCQRLRTLHLLGADINTDPNFRQLTQLTSLVSNTAVDLDAVSALTGLQHLELPESTGSGAELSCLTALTRLLLGFDAGSLHGRELAGSIWQHLQAMSQLQELVLLQDICSVEEMWESHMACRHRHLRHLELDLDRCTLPAWGRGHMAVLPCLETLVVHGRRVRVDPLHYMVHAAPNVKRVVLPACLDLSQTAIEHSASVALHWLTDVFRRLGVPATTLEFKGDSGLSICGKEGLSESDTVQLMGCLQPLSNLQALALRLRLPNASREAMQALHLALPNLHKLELLMADVTPSKAAARLAAIQVLPRFAHLRALTLHSIPDDCSAAIHVLESMQLQCLDLKYDKTLGLLPWVHHRSYHTFPHLRQLKLFCQGYNMQLQDLHYLLHAAPSLERFAALEGLGIVVDSCDGAYSHPELVQQLAGAAQRLSAINPGLDAGRVVIRSTQANQDMQPMFAALAPLSRLSHLHHLIFSFTGELTPAASKALAAALPDVGLLKLSRCTVQHPAALAPLAGMRNLHTLELHKVQGPAQLPLFVAMFQAAAPRVDLEMDGCGWWTQEHRDAVDLAARGYLEVKAGL